MPLAPMLKPACLALWLVAATALAQIPGLPAKTDATAAPAQAAIVPIGDIAQRADDDEAFVQEVIQRSKANTSADTLKERLTTIQRNVDDLAVKAQGNRLDTMTLSSLEALERYLSFLDHQLHQWQTEQQAAARPVSADAATLLQRRKLWQDTRTAIAGSTMSALTQRIDLLLGAIGQAERAVSQPLTQLLALGREAAALQTRVSQATAAAAARIAAIDRRLWSRDTDNLFTALASAERAPALTTTTLREQLGADSIFANDLTRGARNLSVGVLVLALALLPLVLWLSARARKAFAGDPGLERHRKALTRPLSAWLLLNLGVLMTIQFFGPLTPLRLLLLLAWLPIMRLQPNPIRSLLGRGIYFSGAFLLLELIAQAVAPMPLLFRLLLLLNSVAMLAVLAWLLRRLLRAQRLRDSRVLRLLRNLLAGGCAALAAAIASNLVGNVTLAAMLTEATLDSAYVGLFLLAASNTVRGWLRYVFRPTAQRLGAGRMRAGKLLQVLSQLFELALFLAWLYVTLDAFRVWRPLQGWLRALFEFTLHIGSLTMTVGGIALFCVSVYLSFWFAKTVRGVLAEDVLPRMTLPRGVANSASTMSYYALLILGLLVALTAAGFQASQVALVLGALSVGIGFGLQTVVNNFVSGLILMFERPIQPGDTVEVSGTIGTIRDIGMRATTFTTFEGADVVVPNGMLLSEKLVNWTLSTNTRRIDLPLGVAYGSDPAQVRDLLLRVTQGIGGVARHPPPSVLFIGFGASSLDFSVRAWTDYDVFMIVRSDLGIAIHDALKQAGIEIPFPQRDLHLRSIEPELFDRLQPQRAADAAPSPPKGSAGAG